MGTYEDEYRRLNTAQRQAVDTIEGPLLVIAGPGTGKTQLLSMRVANIIRETDTAPSNILCLTFTDNAARAMRERLETVIGQAAYHVAIHTFHSFGSEIINQFPDYFTARQLLQPVDELGRYELLRNIFERLPHGNPLAVKVGDDFIQLRDTLDAISWLKQNALAPAELETLLTANRQFMDATAGPLAETFVASPSPRQLPAYRKLLKVLEQHTGSEPLFGFPPYGAECARELDEAINATPTSSRYAPAITAWRNKWCQKDRQGRQVFKDAGQSQAKMQAVAEVYAALLADMSAQGLYDFDDMIMETVHALEGNDDLRFSLQERYQYVLVDEFQDTNKAQLRLLTALGDNPVHEGRPNIMAVGDDDQAIYAFQGAEASNMVAFYRQYGQLEPIPLEDNYRSTPAILTAAATIAEQIGDRLTATLPGVSKHLTARTKHEAPLLRHSLFPSELAQYDWIAEQIKQLIADGLRPEEIAVIAPRHRYLERLMPYLGSRGLPVAYERRENILDAPIIMQLLTMAELVAAIADNRQTEVDALLGQVLGYDFWGIPDEMLLELSLTAYNKHEHWLPLLAKHRSSQLRDMAAWFLGLAKQSPLEPLEYVLDELLGAVPEGTDSADDEASAMPRRAGFVSPMRAFYFNAERYDQATDQYLTLLGQLSTLRQRLRQWKPNRALHMKDLVEFAELHIGAGLKIVDTNPHTQTTNAVQVMTAYKAKGLEFTAVFVINVQDEIWGPTARSRRSSIRLPANLPIAPASDSDNDRLRLLFVALTRAKRLLHLTSYSHTLENKLSPGLSFLDAENAAGLQPVVVDTPATPQAVEILATDWTYRFRQIIADKPTLFEPILARYHLSVTHLNNFVDVQGGGPHYFFMHNLLRFPEAPTPSAAYGDAIHQTLRWAHLELRGHGRLPATTKLQAYFEDLLARKHLRPSDERRLARRGREALEHYFRERGKQLSAQDIVERGFNNEGVVVNGAALSGNIDKLRLDGRGQAEVIDFKTGRPAGSWQGKDEYEKVKLHKYRQQLLFYKLLVEQSASFRRKLTVTAGALEFIEADDRGQLAPNLELTFDSEELARFTELIGAVWQHIMELNFPDVSRYSKNLKGMQQFETDLIERKI